MIIDPHQLIDRAMTADPPYDVCIVGAGPAGISLALELAGTDLRICVLEAGGERYQRASQQFCEGESAGDAYPPLRDTRLAALGGSTGIWAGWCRPLDERDFEPSARTGACGWPFGRSELLPYYRRAQERCGLAPFEYDPACWQERGLHPLLLAEDPALEHAIFHVLPLQFGARYRRDLETSRNVHVVLNAPVARLLIEDNGAVAGVAIRTLDGLRFDLAARRYVLCAGGIENARTLLLSAGSPDRAPGNARDLVGRFFTDHPFVNFATLVLNEPPRRLDFYFPRSVRPTDASGAGASGPGLPAVRGALTFRRSTLENEGIQNAALYFLPRYESHPAFESGAVKAFLEIWNKLNHRAVPGGLSPYVRRAARGPHRIGLAAARKLLVKDAPARRWRMRAMFETQSQYGNRVTLSAARDRLDRPRARIEWRLSDYDLECMRRVRQLLDLRLRQTGSGRLEHAFPDTLEAWRQALEGGKHQMGTTRMHRDPRYGVVDPDGRVHGCPNLYVTGSSVFPSGGYANPTLTIVALAIRLADHLRSTS